MPAAAATRSRQTAATKRHDPRLQNRPRLSETVAHLGLRQVLTAAEAAGPRPTAVTGSPYRGLAAFGEQDAAFFFGREAATAQVLDRMSRLLVGAGLLVVSEMISARKPGQIE